MAEILAYQPALLIGLAQADDADVGHDTILPLPIIVPQLSYKLLDVQNGTQTPVVWEGMIRASIRPLR
jgi:hypothetical protein